MAVHRVASLASSALAEASSGQTAGSTSYRMVQRLADNSELIVESAIANTLSNNSDNAAAASAFCSAVNSRSNPATALAPSGVAMVTTPITPNIHMNSDINGVSTA